MSSVYRFEQLSLNDIEIDGSVKYEYKSSNLYTTPPWLEEEPTFVVDWKSLVIHTVMLPGAKDVIDVPNTVNGAEIVSAVVAAYGAEEFRKMLARKAIEFADRSGSWI